MEFALFVLDYDGYYRLEIAGGYCDGNCGVCRKCTNNRNIVTLIKEENAEFYQKYVLDHQIRTAELCKKAAEALFLTESKREIFIQSALLHDVGKLLIPFDVLSKNGALSPFERRIIKLHPSKGAEWLRERGFSEEITAVIEAHHERVDGLGYPNGLKGDEIPFLARVLAVCDTADAVISGRHYRAAFDKRAVIEELLRNSGSQFDPMVVRTMIEIIHEEEIANV
ncbi:metal dependent phosphohydrolase [Thermoanaerobacter mathranii subsp. mathranii str. A3]|uniref:Metal dependent phosphohydrolase n=1 Tax=Thermoanaerobacter mathranii subsp. mathranii (strain DSM 11426 / CCUG 53645 / CIP 108742 / A3) TaxID=583358 RepID=A0ABN3YZG4_THEM3|nr:HD domain-containing phosphohydrolase [Thermoanaerobacter mathranii]ADH59857.1 metal dependent phosphohydrolase [Thermoanaerobacter mathranii subsp. mathranii str. A3]